jgi:transposase
MECGPQNCPIIDEKAHRKERAKRLYEQGFSMEAIAALLGVTHKTISLDLKEFVPEVQTLARQSKRGRKGEGRPKGQRPKPKPPQQQERNEKIVAMSDQGMSSRDISNEVGVGERMVDRVLEVEGARREGPTQIDRSELSLTAQQKLDAAIRQHKQKLGASFYMRVEQEVRKRIDEIVLPHWKEKIEQAQKLYEHRRGAMSKETFNTIRRALHPDSRQSISDKKLAEAFDTFMSLEKFLLDEKDSPTEFGDLPKTWAEWEASRVTKPRRKGSNAVKVH